MKIYALVSIIQNNSPNEGWKDFDVIVEADSIKEGRRLIDNWVRRKPRSASQRIIYIVTKEQFLNDSVDNIQYI